MNILENANNYMYMFEEYVCESTTEEIIDQYITNSFPTTISNEWGNSVVKVVRQPNDTWSLTHNGTTLIHRDLTESITINSTKYSNTVSKIQDYIKDKLGDSEYTEKKYEPFGTLLY